MIDLAQHNTCTSGQQAPVLRLACKRLGWAQSATFPHHPHPSLRVWPRAALALGRNDMGEQLTQAQV